MLALGVLSVAFLISLIFWPALRTTTRTRTFVLVAGCVALFALPWLLPAGPIAVNSLVVLVSCTLPVNLVDAALRPRYWAQRNLRAWIAYVLNPFIIVARLHDDAPRDSRSATSMALRGLIEMIFGAVILWWAFSSFGSPIVVRLSFWLEHAIKLAGAYLLVFDGLFTCATGVLRLAGIRVLDLSRNPALSVTPADFWRRYNCEAGRFLRQDVFLPLGGIHHPVRTTILVFLLNGLLHEYLSLLLTGRLLGYQILFFAIQGLAVAATLHWRPRGWPRTAAMVATWLFMYASSTLFFLNLDVLLPWYALR